MAMRGGTPKRRKQRSMRQSPNLVRQSPKDGTVARHAARARAALRTTPDKSNNVIIGDSVKSPRKTRGLIHSYTGTIYAWRI